MSAIEYTPESRVRRVVFEHRLGVYAGLRQIVGTTDDFGGAAPPACSDAFQTTLDPRLAVAGQVLATHTYVLYREIDTNRKTFDGQQR